MLVIHPDECIDCGVCELECPVDAIKPDTEPGLSASLRWSIRRAQRLRLRPRAIAPSLLRSGPLCSAYSNRFPYRGR